MTEKLLKEKEKRERELKSSLHIKYSFFMCGDYLGYLEAASRVIKLAAQLDEIYNILSQNQGGDPEIWDSARVAFEEERKWEIKTQNETLWYHFKDPYGIIDPLSFSKLRAFTEINLTKDALDALKEKIKGGKDE